LLNTTGVWIDDPDVIGVGGTNLETSSGSSLASTYVAENAVADYIGTSGCYDPENMGTCLQPYWWGAGGGESQIFAVPSFQSGLTIASVATTGPATLKSARPATVAALTGRGVPDVGMEVGGCPEEGTGEVCNTQPPYPDGLGDSSDVLEFDGSEYGAIGTSASAPEFAGYVATLDQACACRLGNINNWLYDFKANGYGAFHQSIPSFNGADTYLGNGWNPVVGVGTPDMEGLFAVLGVTTIPAAGNPQTSSNP
jgi:subtilase family serine protease